jgi:tetratricopeptide (TPR) repeat protein
MKHSKIRRSKGGGAGWISPLLILVILRVLSPARAAADTPPSVWDIAKDPPERQRWALHVRVQRLLDAPGLEDDGGGETRLDGELRLEAARAMLEQADAAHSPDIRLRFDLGIVDYALGEKQGGRKDLFQKAIEILRPALDDAPDHPGATEALATLVYAYAKLDRPREELTTWHRYIPRLTDDRTRVVAMMNMGEAEMRLGQVDEALGTFRDVLRLCGELPNSGGAGSTYVLTLWDLAVALDRSGSPQEALESAAKASRMTVISSSGMPTTGGTLIARDPAVFFVPEWEREWYLALRASAAAHDAKDARDAAVQWAQAEQHWTTYVDRASQAGGKETFLPIARLRLERVRLQRVAAEKRAARLPREPAPGPLRVIE